MTEQSYVIYGDAISKMSLARMFIIENLDTIRRGMIEENGTDPIEHYLARIKSDESMRKKCLKKGLEPTTENALEKIHDAIGVRVVCPFLNDVYTIGKRLKELEDIEVIEEKDYIKHAKPNGYRSYHIITKVMGFYCEIQLRTISMDTWAAMEHHMKYKRDLGDKEELFVSELKRLADELASTDISMQTIHDMIYQAKKKEEK
ncbi:MAG: GTP pyrophosphokinase family protein [Eubacterium sp.]|nr:GTP pyrophosphokinase family protein [Eubacterium sp.]